jgi:CRP-like cAMP-binding protein
MGQARIDCGASKEAPMSSQLSALNLTKGRAIDDHPFVVKLRAHAPLNSDDLNALGHVLNRRLTVKKGKDIVVEGYQYTGLDIIESGFAIRYTLMHKGGRQIINTLLPGDIIGFPACFFDRAIFSIMAITKMSLHHITFEAFVELCQKRTNIAMAVIWFAAHEAAMSAHHLVNIGRRAPLERVAHFLMEMHTRLRAVGCASDNSFEIPLSQESIGDAVGLSAPHVNRMLSELKSEGLIVMDGHQIRILDRAALQITAEFDPSYLVRTSVLRHRPKRPAVR